MPGMNPHQGRASAVCRCEKREPHAKVLAVSVDKVILWFVV